MLAATRLSYPALSKCVQLVSLKRRVHARICFHDVIHRRFVFGGGRNEFDPIDIATATKKSAQRRPALKPASNVPNAKCTINIYIFARVAFSLVLLSDARARYSRYIFFVVGEEFED